jgi:hypothetical protein
MISALLIHDVPIECINKAAVTYYVPATVIISVLNTEGGYQGAAIKNRNGSIDYGSMQINSSWLPTLEPYGYTAQKLQFNPCDNVMAGTWILSQQIAESPQYWKGVGDYHSHTFWENATYQGKVWNHYQLLQKILTSPDKTKIQ